MFAGSSSWLQSVHTLFPLSLKWRGEIDIVLFQSGSNGSEFVSYLEMLWWQEVDSTKFCRFSFLLPSRSGKWLEKVSRLRSASLLISLRIFLWANFDSFFPSICSFSDPKICLGRGFLHSVNFTNAWTSFLMNSISFSVNPPLITLVSAVVFHWLKECVWVSLTTCSAGFRRQQSLI